MLSVLVPIYNRDVRTLVQGLEKQLAESGIPYEIILTDDCSTDEYRMLNSSLRNIQHLIYIDNDINMGRAKVRNFLAEQAQNPYLLFIDCDATIIDGQYVRRYLSAIEKMKKFDEFVINGGVAYRNEKPESEYHLRWLYGRRCEQTPASRRNLRPYHHFTPFNVVITKKTFQHIWFDELLTTYGNEDTLFGYQLKADNIPYLHIDNQLYHDGLDSNKDYLRKVEVAIDNLEYIVNRNDNDAFYLEDNLLLRTYHRCKHLGLKKPLVFIFKTSGRKMQRKLFKKPNLVLLDLYKLTYLATKNI